MKAVKWFGFAVAGALALGCKKADEEASIPKDPVARAAFQKAQVEGKTILDQSAKEMAAKDYDSAAGDIVKVLNTPNLSPENAAKAFELQMQLAKAAEKDPAAKAAEDNMRRGARGR